MADITLALNQEVSSQPTFLAYLFTLMRLIHPSLELRGLVLLPPALQYLEPGVEMPLNDNDEVALIPPISGG